MLKVLFLRSTFDPGGTETLLLNLFNYQQNKIEFHYVLLKDGILIPNLISQYNKMYRLFRKSKFDIKVLIKVLKILKYNQIKVIHSHQLIELFYAIIIKCFFPKVKLFHTVHGYTKENDLNQLLERFLLIFTKQSFTVSKASKEILVKRGYPSNKISILYNAVKIPQNASESDISNFKAKIKYNPSDFIIGMIGNFVWQKDQITIVKAFNLLKNEIPELKLILIGRESELSEKCKLLLTEEELKEKVFFLGVVENASRYAKFFNLFIMSTLMDSFGIVVIEALMLKVPVIASDIEVMRELSHNGKYFELFEKENPISLANLIKQSNTLQKKKMVETAFDFAASNFSYENYIYQLFNYYITM